MKQTHFSPNRRALTPSSPSLWLWLWALVVPTTLWGESIEVESDTTPLPLLVPCSVLVHFAPPQLKDNVGLNYRMGGEATHAHECPPAATTDSTALFVIPAAYATPRGLSMQVSASNSRFDTLTEPIDIPLLVPQRRAPDTAAYDQWRLASFPLLPRHTTVAALLHDDLGAPDPLVWRAFEWAGDSGYRELEATDKIAPGTACWLRSRLPRALLDIDTAVTPSLAHPFSITLHPGWNVIANPFAFAVDWQKMIETVSEHSNQLLGPFAWNGSSWDNPLDHPALLPWEGYYVKNELPFDLTLGIPPLESDSVPPIAYKQAATTDWLVSIAVAQADTREHNDLFGVGTNATRLPEPPSGPTGNSPRAGFITDQNTATPCLTDIRTATSSTHRWHYRVQSARTDLPITLSFHRRAGVAAKTSGLVLVDSTAGRVIDLSATTSYTYHPLPTEQSRAFTLVAGDGAYQERPPVLSTTFSHSALRVAVMPGAGAAIDYTVPQHTARGQVQVEIFSLDGALLRTVVDAPHQPGRYRACWDGRDSRGKRVRATTCICRLRVARDDSRSLSFVLTR